MSFSDWLRYCAFKARKRLLWPLRVVAPRTINAIADPRNTAALCASCGHFVRARQYHLGFSEITPLYCSGCGNAVFLDGSVEIADLLPPPDTLQRGDYGRSEIPYWQGIENLFQPCSCGGHFGYLQPPVCPFCRRPVSGDVFEGKPVVKKREGYCFLSGAFIPAAEALRNEHRSRIRQDKF